MCESEFLLYDQWKENCQSFNKDGRCTYTWLQGWLKLAQAVSSYVKSKAWLMLSILSKEPHGSRVQIQGDLQVTQ